MIDSTIACPHCDYDCYENPEGLSHPHGFDDMGAWDDGEYQEGQCPACKAWLKAIASVDISFDTILIDVPPKEDYLENEQIKDLPGQLTFWDWKEATTNY